MQAGRAGHEWGQNSAILQPLQARPGGAAARSRSAGPRPDPRTCNQHAKWFQRDIVIASRKLKFGVGDAALPRPQNSRPEESE